MDDRGFPHPQDEFYKMLPNPSGQLLRKRMHPARALSDIDPKFNNIFDEKLHREYLTKHLKVDHLPPHQQKVLEGLIISKWPVFNPIGLAVPVRDYVCTIDTGTNPPIAVKNPTYGPNESIIIEKAIAQLVSLGLAYQVFDGEWLSKGLLAPKPHQEHITSIDQFAWRFCVSYIALNAITRVIAFPIPRCNDAVGTTFGGSKYVILADCPSGFHQISVDEKSQQKLAFAGPNATKYTYRDLCLLVLSMVQSASSS